MARFFFDIHDGSSSWLDTDGIECNGLEAVRREAMKALPEIACEKISKGEDHQVYTISVRSSDNRVVYSATLNFLSERNRD